MGSCAEWEVVLVGLGIVGSCISLVVLVGSILPGGELSRWEFSWWGVVLLGSCSDGGMA